MKALAVSQHHWYPPYSFMISHRNHKTCCLVYTCTHWPQPKGTVPFGLLICPLWSRSKMFPLPAFSNNLKYLTRKGFPGLLNVRNLITHLLKRISAKNSGQYYLWKSIMCNSAFKGRWKWTMMFQWRAWNSKPIYQTLLVFSFCAHGWRPRPGDETSFLHHSMQRTTYSSLKGLPKLLPSITLSLTR